MRSTPTYRAVSSPLPLFLVATAVAILTLYAFHTLSLSLLAVVSASRSIQRGGLALFIEDLDVYPNGSIRIVLSAEGGGTVYDIRNLDVVVTFIEAASGKPFTYLLRPNANLLIEGVCVKDTAVCFNRNYVRSGEVAILRGFLPALSRGSWGYLAVVTPNGHRAEKAFAVGG